jgi:hypothetical protein
MRLVRRVEDHSHVFIGKEMLLIMLIYEQLRHRLCGGLPQVQVLPPNSPYSRPNLVMISKMVLHWSSLTILLTFTHFICVILGVMTRPECSLPSAKFPYVWIKRTTQKSLFSAWYCQWKLFLAFYMFMFQCSEVETKPNTGSLFLH